MRFFALHCLRGDRSFGSWVSFGGFQVWKFAGSLGSPWLSADPSKEPDSLCSLVTSFDLWSFVRIFLCFLNKMVLRFNLCLMMFGICRCAHYKSCTVRWFTHRGPFYDNTFPSNFPSCRFRIHITFPSRLTICLIVVWFRY